MPRHFPDTSAKGTYSCFLIGLATAAILSSESQLQGERILQVPGVSRSQLQSLKESDAREKASQRIEERHVIAMEEERERYVFVNECEPSKISHFRVYRAHMNDLEIEQSESNSLSRDSFDEAFEVCIVR